MVVNMHSEGHFCNKIPVLSTVCPVLGASNSIVAVPTLPSNNNFFCEIFFERRPLFAENLAKIIQKFLAI